jgi:hypothetical protein
MRHALCPMRSDLALRIWFAVLNYEQDGRKAWLCSFRGDQRNGLWREKMIGPDREEYLDSKKESLEGEHRLKDLAFPAYFHLIAPASLNLSMAYGSTDKPTEMTALELPGGALLLYLHGAVLNVPTGFASILRFLHRQEE